jgi:hypothetical protein
MAYFTLKWASRCRVCGAFLPAGTSVRWHHAWGHSCRDAEACEQTKADAKADAKSDAKAGA